ncbi:MAG: hypothetical protein GC159_16940 [Phycisphaera sp.]|nr:hypothetical protein [Phycisphaera sp.]
MSFPETHSSLIRRLVSDGGEREWADFLEIYWQPLCAFARRRAGLGWEDAEDVAAITIEVLLRNQLLERWTTDRSAKLRTLLCAVVRRVLANQARVQHNRRELLEQLSHELVSRKDLPTLKAGDATQEDMDVLFAAWAEQLLRVAVRQVVSQLRVEGKDSQVAVLKARVCDQLSIKDTAAATGVSTTDVTNYYHRVQKRLHDALQEVLYNHIRPNTPTRYVDAELLREWEALAEHLESHGGLDDAIIIACSDIPADDDPFKPMPNA